MAEDALILVYLDRDVRLVLRKRSGTYRFESWRVPERANLFLQWKLAQNPGRELRERGFGSLEEAKQAFSNELAKIAGAGTIIR